MNASVVYIRSKKVKGIEYAYLVKSEWDQRKGSSVQHTIKYLGRADAVAVNDIPEQFRNDARILSFLSSHSSENLAKKEALLEKLRAELFEALCSADREKASRIAIKYQSLFSLIEFYEDLLTPVMYRVGDLWAQGRLTVATEHVCSNIAVGLVDAINETNATKPGRSAIVICSPEGEMHHLAAKVLESVLMHKAYRVHNMSPSAPTDSIVDYISSSEPGLAMVSVTLPENLKAATRLVDKIVEETDTPVFLGGAALMDLDEKEKKRIMAARSRLTVVTDSSLQQLVRSVRAITNAS